MFRLRMRHGFNVIMMVFLAAVCCRCAISATRDNVDGANSFSVKVEGNTLWTNTEISVKEGDILVLSATGEVEITKWSYFGRDDYDYQIHPAGTYNYADDVGNMEFPMPSALSGPVPCYGLIGKFGEDGDPFFVGKGSSLTVHSDSVLFLGINDFDVTDNKGAFDVEIDIYDQEPEDFHLMDTRRIVDSAVMTAGEGAEETKKPKVFLLYIDGLNCDVLKEMVFTGYLPNIKKYFFDKGANFVNAYTTFPSSTFQSAGSTLTGMYLDMTGIKQEMFFDREKRKVDHFFKPFGPNTAARTLRPEIVGKISSQRPDALRLIYDYTADNDLKYGATILPVQHQSPPVSAMRTIANTGYFSAHEVHYNLDEINSSHALRHVIKRSNDLMYVWLPGPDVSGHISARGLWGMGRKKLSIIDGIIGEMMEKLKSEGIFEDTYKILYSDHGHIGGKDYINQPFDITNDLFFKDIIVSNSEVSTAGGLGFNVKFAEDDRVLMKSHPESDKEHYMISAVEGFGMVNIYLPYESRESGNMSVRNNLYNLTNYRLLPETPPINILERILRVDKSEANEFPDNVSSRPVDLALMTLDEGRMLIMKSNGAQAIVEYKRLDEAKRPFVYRYKIVGDIKQREDGEITFDERLTAEADPLGYLDDPYFLQVTKEDGKWLSKFHTAEEWLEATMYSQYPDAVVQFAHFLLWDESIKDLKKRYEPDLVVTANRGWNFRSDGVISTDHGYPFDNAMRIPLFISGPSIKEGVILTQPKRIVDILPAILDIFSIDYDKDSLDGRSFIAKMEKDDKDTIVVANEDYRRNQVERYVQMPHDYAVSDLQHDESWGQHRGVSTHDYNSALDLHNVAANVKFTFDLSLIKIGDDIMDFVIPSDDIRPIGSFLDFGARALGGIPDNLAKRRFIELLDTVNIAEFSIADTAMLSGNFANEGTFHRANALIDWAQNIMGDINKLLGLPIYRFKKGLIPGKSLNKYMIDYPQHALESVRKNITEVVGRSVFSSIDGIEYGVGKIGRIGSALRGKDNDGNATSATNNDNDIRDENSVDVDAEVKNNNSATVTKEEDEDID